MSNGHSEQLRITQLQLRNWKNFRHAELRLSKRAFFVGPNASGKSNLLDAIRFLRHLAAAVGGGFQEAVNSRGGVSSIRCLAARKQPTIVIEAKVGNEHDPNIWSYLVDFSQDNNQNPIIKREIVHHRGKEVRSRPDAEDERDTLRLRQTHLEQISANQEFRDLYNFFASIRYLHLVPQLVREPNRSIGRENDPYGGDFLKTVASTTAKTREFRLRKIQEALKIAVPQLSELTTDQDIDGFWHLRAKYTHWRPQGAWQREESFSDGTLRLLGLLWSILESGGPLLLEEPELSLHPAVVRQIPEMFIRMQRRSGRQTLVTTHSDALLADPGIGLDEVHLLSPGPEGTTVTPAADVEDISLLLEGGVPLGEAILPKARPERIDQLARFE